MRIPTATYRLQFTKDFRFADARAIVPLLARLGISDLYASPIFQARGGSSHGYDVTNPGRLNPELGTREEFDALAAELKQHGMGLLLDIVPNHMAVSVENEWWVDVLENGTGSPYSGFFGVDWDAGQRGPEEEKIYLPILGDPFGKALEWGHLQLKFSERGLFVTYFSHQLPLDPGTYGTVLDGAADLALPDVEAEEWRQLLESIRLLPRRVATKWELVEGRARVKEDIKRKLWELYTRVPVVHEFLDARIRLLNGTPGDSPSYNALEQLLNQQPYRLAYWRVAREKINYRRFFDVTDLIGIRAELPNVFEATHTLALELYAAGQVNGFRIDHIDGLLQPRQYLARLREAAGPDAYIVVEKITLGPEELPVEWPVQGTTGYDFLAEVNGAFTYEPGLRQIEAFYHRFADLPDGFETFCYHNKKRVMETLFKGEVLHLGDLLVELSEVDRYARDISPAALQAALLEVTACLPVYRTYIESADVTIRDQRVIEHAMACARERSGDIDPEAYRFLERVLRVKHPPSLSSEEQEEWLRFVQRWQQLTGPIMAKGVEDTTFYQYNRLVSLNEVGGNLEPLTRDQFHERQHRRQRHWPHTLNASSTHDTKRGEDVRARLSVLAELAGEWERLVRRWSRFNHGKRVGTVPPPNEEYFLYQILVGAWPLCEDEIPAFHERLHGYLVKASREAKIHSSWFRPDEEFEKAFQSFASAILAPDPENRFYQQFREFQQRIAFYGAMTSLSQELVKATAPGVPDFYQGTGFWDLSLVDPDNRRPVDYQRRDQALDTLGTRPLSDLLRNWRDGAVKLFLTHRLLQFRRGAAALFACGSYLPLTAEGKRSENLIVFARQHEDQWVIAVAPRFYSQLSVLLQAPLGRRIWQDTRITLPEGAPSDWRNVLTGETLPCTGSLAVADVLCNFPVALLTSYSVLP